MPKARLYFDGDNTWIEKEAREYSLTQAVEDKLDSIDTIETTLQGEIDDLQDQIDNLASRGRYLSTWDCVSWLPDTNPQTDPYVYRAWDYYIVSTVGWTNYRPNGSEYHIWVASQVVESLPVSQNDLYIYDWIQWILQQSWSSLNAVWWSITWTLSAQTDLQNALNTKANAVDLNTKTFVLSWNSWQTALDEAQAIFDYWNSGKNPIVKYWSTQYYVSRFTDNWTNKFLTFASLNETLYSGVEEWMPKLVIRASSSTDVVNNIDDSWHYRTWEIYTAGSWIDITGNVISSDVISWDAGTTYTIKVANADPASWTPATTITFVL